MVAPLGAEIRLPSILGDNMVLQQQSSVPIWGKAAPGRKITVKASWGKYASTTVAADSSWLIRLETPSSGGPYDVVLHGDGPVLTIHNVLIGEVWLCSGQSNMEMRMRGYPSQPVDGALDAIIAAEPSVPIRLVRIPHQSSPEPLWDCRVDGWRLNEAAAVAEASATAYYFGHFLYEKLHVPIGLIMTSWGGTAIEPWMSGGNIYNAMLAPLAPYAVKGFIWYQGERNRPGNQPGKPLYSELQAEFVKTLRSEFGDGSSAQSFYYVQIAPYPYDDPNGLGSAYMYEQQAAALNLIPNSGMVVTNDIGSASVIHPSTKPEVGRRLALLALQRDYGLLKGLDLSYPFFKSMETEGNRATLTFAVGPGALAPLHQDVIGFEAAGEDRVFYPAKARVNPDKRNTVELSCEQVRHIAAVRYCFHNYQVGTLTNIFRLPACPFRTDNW